MSNRKDWQKFQSDTEICEKNEKYYLKSHPEYLYNSYEEAKEASDFLRSVVAF